MNTRFIEPVLLDDKAIKSLTKLLGHSWSAEYSLRITPILNNEDYLQAALQWTYPQAYWSTFFSMRAVLITLGIDRASTLAIVQIARSLHSEGMYGDQIDFPANFLEELHNYTFDFDRATLTNNIALQNGLVATVEKAAMAHEAHILECIGLDNYNRILDFLPPYMGFVEQRAQKLISKQAVLC